MTDTRKQIIELIEPWMDKTIDKGLYFYDRGDICNVAEIIGGDVIWIRANQPKGVTKDLFLRFGFGREIIGHYDITAVLKALYARGYIDYHREFIRVVNTLGDILGQIRNKPLHLYTEEEDKDLLELLKKLGATQEK